jgi:cholesterol oxidase
MTVVDDYPLATDPLPSEIDTLIIGSGFGGSVVAHRLAVAAHRGVGFAEGRERAARVHMVERGRHYAMGSFARQPHEMRENTWDPDVGRIGLFNIWSFDQLDAIFASGLGGGSLIYANVLLRPDQDELKVPHDVGEDGCWPVKWVDLDFDRIESELAVERYPSADSTDTAYQLPKATAMGRVAATLGAEVKQPPLAVRFSPRPNDVPEEAVVIDERAVLAPLLAGLDKDTADKVSLDLPRSDRPRTTCRQCAECDIGCNYGSKNTLDHTYLRVAGTLGIGIHVMTEVRRIERTEGGYLVTYVTHRVGSAGTTGAKRRPPSTTVKARSVVLAAGALGSTFLLLDNREHLTGLSPALGTRISGNGDALAFVTKTDEPVDPTRGPVITTSMRRRGDHHYLQDGGFPGLLTWLTQANPLSLAEQALSFVYLSLRRSRTVGSSVDQSLSLEASRLLGSNLNYRHTLPLLVMGHDRRLGRATVSDGVMALDWTFSRNDAYFTEIVDHFDDVVAVMGGALSLNPLFERRKRSITAHPLGGCPMGSDPAEGDERSIGVVDGHGEVYGYPAMFVVDGAVMPGPVGPNPSLTIAAHADHFAKTIVAGFLERLGADE